MPYTPIALARLAADHLRARGIENARLDAELMLASVLGLSRLELYLQHDRPLTPEEVERFRALVRRRLRHEPLQYILGEVHFRELVLKSDRRALIARPETEILVGEVLMWARARGGDDLRALDIGTGSGAIALSLAYEGPFAHVVATDLSADALALATENAARYDLGARVEFREGTLFEPLGAGERFDVIVSNPPYIAEAERGELAPEVREWEPGTALFAPDEGLRILYALVDGAPRHLRAGGLLALEIGSGQGSAVSACIAQREGYGPARVVHDLAGHDRVVLAEWAPD